MGLPEGKSPPLPLTGGRRGLWSRDESAERAFLTGSRRRTAALIVTTDQIWLDKLPRHHPTSDTLVMAASTLQGGLKVDVQPQERASYDKPSSRPRRRGGGAARPPPLNLGGAAGSPEQKMVAEG